MTEHSYTKLRRFERCVAGMIADPDCTGDLLLLGMWMARATILNDPPRGEGGWTFDKVAETLYGGRHLRQPGMANWKIQSILRKDIPRYDALAEGENYWVGTPCGAPMVRRAGTCGKRSTHSAYATDVTTGRRFAFGSCTRHKDWFQAKYRGQPSRGQGSRQIGPDTATERGRRVAASHQRHRLDEALPAVR